MPAGSVMWLHTKADRCGGKECMARSSSDVWLRTQFRIIQYSWNKKHDGLRTKITCVLNVEPETWLVWEQSSWLYSCLSPFCLSMNFISDLLSTWYNTYFGVRRSLILNFCEQRQHPLSSGMLYCCGMTWTQAASGCSWTGCVHRMGDPEGEHHAIKARAGRHTMGWVGDIKAEWGGGDLNVGAW